jgi:hypothetical protein
MKAGLRASPLPSMLGLLLGRDVQEGHAKSRRCPRSSLLSGTALETIMKDIVTKCWQILVALAKQRKLLPLQCYSLKKCNVLE